jgi:hypothetical protein
VVEVFENDQEIICREIRENMEDLDRVQEKILTKMESFNRQATQDIKSTIIESSNKEAFNEFAENLTVIQESTKEFNRMEAQHETIFRKEGENTCELIGIKEKVTEGIMKQEENQENRNRIEKEIKIANGVIIRNIHKLDQNAEIGTFNSIQQLQEEIKTMRRFRKTQRWKENQ